MQINYLFPPDCINDLPTWRFILHFIAPPKATAAIATDVVQGLSQLELSVANFACDEDDIELDEEERTVSIPMEVTEADRKTPTGLEAYESDVWKIIGVMAGLGFTELYYDAFDWEDDE